MDDTTRDDYLWLMSDAATPLLQRARLAFVENENPVRLARLLRKGTTANRSALVMEQAQLRLRAMKKFLRAEKMFFTRRGLEQATGTGIARYKASRFADCEGVADICCGVGGDLLALAQRADGGSTVGVDADELTASFARHNLAVGNQKQNSHARVEHQSFEAFSDSAMDGLHCDPDRRGKGDARDRTVHGNRFEPSLDSVLRRTSSFKLVAVKIAPATPDTTDWPDNLEREWIGDRRECKQQVLWLGPATARPGQRTATCVEDDGTANRFSVPESKVSAKISLADAVGSFIYEPHPAVLAGKLGAMLGQQFGLQHVARGIAYFTGDNADPLPLVTSFRVRDVLPLHLREVAELLKSQDVGTIEVKRRGVEQIAGDQFAKLKLSGSQRATVFLTRLGDKRIVVIADRIVQSSRTRSNE